jgi:F0F1-type ATP synthase membrane subunit b/b'
LSPNVATFLFEAANFALLAAVLGWAFFRPVQGAIEAHRAGLEAARRAAEEDRAEAALRLAEVEARQREVEASLEPLRAALRRDAESEATRLREAARRGAEDERAALRAELASLRRAHARALARDAAGAARLLVERLLAAVDGPELDLAMVRAFARKLSGQSLATAGTVLVETARPLSAEASETLALALGSAPGEPRVRVVPSLIGGLRVTTDAGLIDASIAGMGEEAERELVKRLEREAEQEANRV